MDKGLNRGAKPTVRKNLSSTFVTSGHTLILVFRNLYRSLSVRNRCILALDRAITRLLSSRKTLLLENLVLRQQLAVLKRKIKRPRLNALERHLDRMGHDQAAPTKRKTRKR